MTATDELRRLLDERGIEYEPIDSVHSPNRRTLWGKVERGKGIFGMDAKYETIEFKKGMRLTISDCSPEQAVEATLGSDLQAENERLRELVHIAGTYCVNGMCGKDDGCPLYLGKPYCALPDRMRELGVEI